MATNVKFDTGGGITTSLPAATGSSGDPYVNGFIRGVLLADSDGTNASVLTDFTAIVDLLVEAKDGNGNSAVAVGDRLYYDSVETIKINKDSINGKFYGIALEAVTSGSNDTIRVGFGGSYGVAYTDQLAGVAVTADGAIAVPTQDTRYSITKAGVAAMTLVDPTAVTHDFIVLTFVSATAQAHTLSNAAGSGFNAAGAGGDVGTFGGAIGDGIIIMAYGGKWLVLNNINVTLA